MEEAPAEVIQPDEGQGDGSATDTPYAEYLDRIPEEVRGDVEPIFKEWDANTTKKFQEAAEYRKGWEPYEQLGVNQLDPGEMEWLLGFRNALQDPQAIQQWYDSYAQQYGLTPQQQEFQPQTEDFSDYDPDRALEQKLEERLGPISQQLQQFAQWQQHLDYQARFSEAERYIQSEIEELKQKHPDEFDEEKVEMLVGQYVESDPQNAVRRAFDDWRALKGQIEKDTLQGKLNQPAPAEYGGVADGAPEQIKTLAQAAQIAKERLRQSNMG